MDNDTSVQPQPFIIEGTRNGGSSVRTTGRLDSYGVGKLPAAWWFPAPRGVEFQCPHGLELLRFTSVAKVKAYNVSMPSWAWVVTPCRQCEQCGIYVSMPSWAWVVTARMSNILNFSWYFLCIPAIYKCILAYLPIFFNQLSKFLRCESPSTFLGTCLSHHSFIIFLVTNTNTLLSGLYLISTNRSAIEDRRRENCVNALSGLYLISTQNIGTAKAG